MKPAIYLTLLLSISSTAYADAGVDNDTTRGGLWSVHLNYDASSKHHAYGVAFMRDLKERFFNVLVMSAGFSIERVKSEVNLESNGEKSRLPLNVLLKFSLDYQVTPFFEAGFDLIDNAVESINFDGDSGGSDMTDYYFSLGLSYRINNKYGVSVYQKNIYIRYEGDYQDGGYQKERVDLEMIGVSGYFHF